MGKKLAIKGHPTRGKEVIELLEMMDGNNNWDYDGSDGFVYFIEEDDKYITFCGKECIKNTGEYIIYELEEFLEKYPFKVGDIIKFPNNMAEKIAEMKWDNELKDIIYTSVSGWTRLCHIPKNINNNSNMKDNKPTGSRIDFSLTERIELDLGDTHEVIVENGKTYVVKKKPTYPKTYEECSLINGAEGRISLSIIGKFTKLVNARNAYWKIAGEEMGLDKPWEPDWNEETNKFTISNKCNKIYLNNTAWYAEVLSFPTKEMCDAFYENFKDLIEQCKELL